MTHDDNELWQKVIETVKPLRKTATQLPAKKSAAKKKAVVPRAPIQQKPAERMIKQPQPLPQKQVKKLRQQKISIEGRIDLHGYYVSDAHDVLTAFMRQAHMRGWRCVEIITGRGNPERGTGQLKRLVPLWLEGMGGISILHVEPNPVSRGGSYLVLLRRRKD